MSKYTIFSPALAGVAQDQPSIKIQNIFSTNNSNVRINNGEVVRNKMRLPEIVDVNGDVISFPRRIFTLIENIPDNPSIETDDKFVIEGDQTDYIEADDTIRIMGSVSNDTTYTVDTVTFDTSNPSTYLDGRTLITVEESITDSTDFTGVLWQGDSCVIHQRTLVDDVQDEFLFLFTSYNIFRWDFSLKTLTNVWTVVGAAEVVNWSTDLTGNAVLATNNSDIPLIGTSSTNFKGIDTDEGPEVSTGVYIVRAKLVKEFENYTLLGNVVLSDGTALPTVFYNSKLNFPEEWDAGDSALFDIAGNDHIQGWGTEFDHLIIFKERSIHDMYFDAGLGDKLFVISNINSTIGCKAQDSIINDADGRLYYFATDKTIKSLREGEISQKIDPTLANIVDELVPYIKGTFIDEYSQIWWAIPVGATTTINNKVVVLDNNRIWNFIDMEVASFGQYSRVETQTWDNITFPNWDSWDQPWNSAAQNKGFPIDLVANCNSSVYASHESSLDITSSFEGYFVLTTDLAQKQALPIFKRLLDSEWYFTAGVGSTYVTISIKDSNQSVFTEVGTLDISNPNGNEIVIVPLSLDIRSKSFDIKVSGTNPYQFIGCVLSFEPAGSR